MSCTRFESKVFLHAHNQLGGIHRWLVESHIQSCPLCRSRWAQWTVERDRLRRAFSPLPTDATHLGGVTASVAARIRVERPHFEEPGRGMARGISPRHVMVVAVVGALLAAGISAFAAYWQPTPATCPSVPAIGNQPAGAANGPAPAANGPVSCPTMPVTTPADPLGPKNNLSPAHLLGSKPAGNAPGSSSGCTPVAGAKAP